MQIVIDIPEEKYDWIMRHLTLDINFRECKITPLPKGHGRWVVTDDDLVYCPECEDSYYPRPIDTRKME